ncbi:MAG: hypothetical protein R3B69_01240 [Candidatus Paceibacterota bacterium]
MQYIQSYVRSYVSLLREAYQDLETYVDSLESVLSDRMVVAAVTLIPLIGTFLFFIVLVAA